VTPLYLPDTVFNSGYHGGRSFVIFTTLKPPGKAKLEGPEFMIPETANSAPSTLNQPDFAHSDCANVAPFENAQLEQHTKFLLIAIDPSICPKMIIIS
jgi:hypothetical protein